MKIRSEVEELLDLREDMERLGRQRRAANNSGNVAKADYYRRRFNIAEQRYNETHYQHYGRWPWE